MRSARPGRRDPAALVAAFLLALPLILLAACSTGSTSSQPGPSASTTTASASASAETSPTGATAAACADAEALRSSLQALTKVSPLQDGLTAVRGAIDTVKANLDKAERSASAALAPAVARVRTAFDQLETAAAGVTVDNLPQKGPAISGALSQVASATSALVAEITHSCPGT